MSMVAMTFITTGYLVGRNGHIVLEIFDELLAGTKLFVALRVISAVIMAATSLALAYEAFVKIETEWGRLSAAMHMPLGVLYIFALIGFLSAAIHSVIQDPVREPPRAQARHRRNGRLSSWISGSISCCSSSSCCCGCPSPSR